MQKHNSQYKPSNLWSRDEVADYLGLSKSTLSLLQRQEKLVGKLVPGAGRVVYYEPADVEAYREKREERIREKISQGYKDPEVSKFFSRCGKRAKGVPKTYKISREELSRLRSKASRARWDKRSQSPSQT